MPDVGVGSTPTLYRYTCRTSKRFAGQ